METLALIGKSVSHSLSPAMHNAAFKYLGMDYEYSGIELESSQLKDFTDRARNEYIGFNVTAPYKTEIIRYLDSVSPEAEFAESVNTVLVKNKKLHGYSTDGYGFERAIVESFNANAKNEKFFFIGCGGAAKAVITHLLFLGVKSIIITNRTESKAEEFAVSLRKEYSGAEILSCGLSSEEIAVYLKDFPIVVQATSLGLKMDDALPFNPEFLKSGMRVFDMIYKNTAFLVESKKRGCIAVNGLLMLLYQGVKSFEIWTGNRAPTEVMKKAMNGLLQRTRGVLEN